MVNQKGFIPRWAMAAGAIVFGVIGVWIVANTALRADKDTSGEAPESEVVATVGDVTITESDLEEVLSSELKRLERERHQLFEQALENLVSEKLLEVEAAARGATIDELIESEVRGKVSEVSDEQVDEFYESRKAQIGQPKEQVATQIRQFLQQQQLQQLQTDLIASLRVKHEVRQYLEPLRIAVDDPQAPAAGPADAPVVIVEFSDFQCPFCSRVVPTLDRILDTYGDKVRLVFRQFPLHRIHPEAQKAAEASLCARDQGKFWEMHDAMFADQRALAVAQLKETAAEVGLDADSFAECLDSGRYEEQVDQDLQAGVEAGVSGTPALFVNGRFLSGAQPYDEIAKLIDDELKRLEG
jgi:protein-disulfide isomerase